MFWITTVRTVPQLVKSGSKASINIAYLRIFNSCDFREIGLEVTLFVLYLQREFQVAFGELFVQVGEFGTAGCAAQLEGLVAGHTRDGAEGNDHQRSPEQFGLE